MMKSAKYKAREPLLHKTAGEAGSGKARHGMARPGKAGMAGQGEAGPGKARQAWEVKH
jgi:hypothetical protein